MEFKEATSSFVASPQESDVLRAEGRLVWSSPEVGELIDLAAAAATRLAGADLSEYPQSADGMRVRFAHEADALHMRFVLSCLKKNTSMTEEDYEQLSQGL
jgi:hypothetical protein